MDSGADHHHPIQSLPPLPFPRKKVTFLDDRRQISEAEGENRAAGLGVIVTGEVQTCALSCLGISVGCRLLNVNILFK